jgi:hypothetical protein
MTEIKWVNRLTYIAILLFSVAAGLFCIIFFIEPEISESRQRFLGVIYLV